MLKRLNADIEACMARDPAARSKAEVIFAYPGFHALLFYRLSHWLWGKRLYLLGRIVSHLGRFFSAIEIHPAAEIGEGFFVDHGSGVVVGATAVIGNNVTLYHDVTLGGIAPSIDSDSQRDQKRHPTVEDDVIIGSGAQILGPIVVGKGARVGANSVVLSDVPPATTVVGIPAKAVRGQNAKPDADRFLAYGIDVNVSDPVAHILDALLDKVQTLSMRVEELERRNDGTLDWTIKRPLAADDRDDSDDDDLPLSRKS